MSVLTSILLMAAAAAGEPAIDCDNAMTQRDMNICADREYEDADAALNEQWKETAADMKQRDAEWGDSFGDDGPGYFDQLLSAQRAWLNYRDAQCTSEGYMARGGSMQSMLVSTCLTNLTKQRTEQLKELESGLGN